MSADAIPEAEVIEEPEVAAPEPTQALVPVAVPSGGGIVRADSPEDVLSKASQIATPLAKFIKDRNLATQIGNGEHVQIEAWEALGAMLGALGGESLYAHIVWTRPVVGPDGQAIKTEYHVRETRKKYGKVDGRRQVVEERVIDYDVEGYDWEAKAEIRTAGGLVVGTAEGMCSRKEAKWMDSDDYAVRSMASTRACSRAFRQAAGWVIALAGYQPTPAEEMPSATSGPAFGPALPGEHSADASTALTHLLDGELDLARERWGQLKTRFGYMPEAAGLALIIAAGLGQVSDAPAKKKPAAKKRGSRRAAPAEEPAAAGEPELVALLDEHVDRGVWDESERRLQLVRAGATDVATVESALAGLGDDQREKLRQTAADIVAAAEAGS